MCFDQQRLASRAAAPLAERAPNVGRRDASILLLRISSSPCQSPVLRKRASEARPRELTARAAVPRVGTRALAARLFPGPKTQLQIGLWHPASMRAHAHS